MTGYPDNVCVHGNGFVQISLGGDPHETRIHVWHPTLTELTQKVNTQMHNHRFGFVSTVLKGVMRQKPLDVRRDEYGQWKKWTAGPTRLPSGNRELILQEGLFNVRSVNPYEVRKGQSYSMEPCHFHTTTPVTDIVVTLMTKTVVLPEGEYQASVMCNHLTEPDQEYSRFQIPWDDLERMLEDCLHRTPFEDTRPWRHATPR